jgi:hypothetical protein
MYLQYLIKAILDSKDHETINKREGMKKLIGKLLLIKPKGHQKRWKFK